MIPSHRIAVGEIRLWHHAALFLKGPVFFFHKTVKVNAEYPEMIADIGYFCLSNNKWIGNWLSLEPFLLNICRAGCAFFLGCNGVGCYPFPFKFDNNIIYIKTAGLSGPAKHNRVNGYLFAHTVASIICIMSLTRIPTTRKN
jgi:hypothetical protein